ncbi:sugar kinase [Leucobacter sp. CSA1]|uniref:Sugar kinase n=1 Tax=Leucobacter chromiisoli TaxID=2796471 RepID=A0A934Q6N5_9MICO|nr:sugar kinase [Leucobacter chromiisoli]MBK0418408.1 sugar kinase [Leucobacter chromiisoli]
MTPPSVVTIGIHIVDILGHPVAAVPEGQGIAFLDEIRMTPAGTCAATAMGLARLGIPVATLGYVGDDDLGSWLRGRLAEEGVDVSGLRTSDRSPTSATMLPIRPNGERPALHVRGANSLVDEELIDWDALGGASHLHVGGTSLLPLLDGEATARVLERARGLGMTTSLDLIFDPAADYERLLGPCYEHLDYFLPNEEDALAISRATDRGDAAAWFLDRGVGAVAVTLGADGAAYAARGADAGTVEEFRVPAFDVEVVDTTGCGDAFSAGFIAALVEGHGAREAVELGVACGSLVATGLGSDAGLTDRNALLRFVRTAARRPEA